MPRMVPLTSTKRKESRGPGDRERSAAVNRTQAIVLGFLLLAWVSLIVILAVAPAVYDETLRGLSDDTRAARAVFLAALSGLLGLLGVGVLRRWRWTFWLFLVAFLAGALRVPASLLQLLGMVPGSGPTWYVLFQALLGVIQFVIGLAMLIGYRRAGAWAAF
jgi:hypothetical protein